MFSSFFKVLRAFGYLITGRLNKFKETLNTNPAVVAASFDAIVESKKKTIKEYEDAIAQIMTQEEKYLLDLKKLNEQVIQLEKNKLGASNKAKNLLINKFNGDISLARKDIEFVKVEADFKDFTSTIAEKKERITEKEEKVKEYAKRISDQKLQLAKSYKDINAIKNEKAETIADIAIAQEDMKLAKVGTIMSEDSSEKELEALRAARDNIKAKAKVATETAGVQSSVFESDYLEYARESSGATDEFEALLGVAKVANNSSQEELNTTTTEKISVE